MASFTAGEMKSHTDVLMITANDAIVVHFCDLCHYTILARTLASARGTSCVGRCTGILFASA